MTAPKRTQVVIAGGGFAGVACAKLLVEEERAPATLTFEHTEVFRGQDGVTLVKAEAVAADVDQRSVTLADGTVVSGDYLELAAGAQPNFFHTPGARDHAFPLYSLTDARRLRERVLQVIGDAAAKPEHSGRDSGSG